MIVEGKEQEKQYSFNPFIVLVSIVVLCTIASYIVAPGAFDRQVVNGLKVVIPIAIIRSVVRRYLCFKCLCLFLLVLKARQA